MTLLKSESPKGHKWGNTEGSYVTVAHFKAVPKLTCYACTVQKIVLHTQSVQNLSSNFKQQRWAFSWKPPMPNLENFFVRGGIVGHLYAKFEENRYTTSLVSKLWNVWSSTQHKLRKSWPQVSNCLSGHIEWSHPHPNFKIFLWGGRILKHLYAKFEQNRCTASLSPVVCSMTHNIQRAHCAKVNLEFQTARVGVLSDAAHAQTWNFFCGGGGRILKHLYVKFQQNWWTTSQCSHLLTLAQNQTKHQSFDDKSRVSNCSSGRIEWCRPRPNLKIFLWGGRTVRHLYVKFQQNRCTPSQFQDPWPVTNAHSWGITKNSPQPS